jgi:nitronate monooxygenase/enoyl-[acyl-carrier protein] reductase II
MLHTPLCHLVGLDLPVIAAPFGPWDEVDLAAAVCEAGGLGSLGTAVRPLEELRAQWARLRERTSRPFAINHQTRPFDHAVFDPSLEDPPAAISFSLGDPGELVARAHDAGALWIQQVMTAEQARIALDRGADVLIAQGAEAGGHSGEIGTIVIVPQVVDLAGSVPVVAAGGIADGRGIAAALALGAQGVVMATRLLASYEMAIDAEWKDAIADADATDAIKDDVTDVLLPPYNRPHWPARPRLLRTRLHDEWLGREEELAARAGEIAPRVIADVLEGRGHDVLPFAGQSAGLVHGVRPAAEIIRDAVAGARDILGATLERVHG